MISVRVLAWGALNQAGVLLRIKFKFVSRVGFGKGTRRAFRLDLVTRPTGISTADLKVRVESLVDRKSIRGDRCDEELAVDD